MIKSFWTHQIAVRVVFFLLVPVFLSSYGLHLEDRDVEEYFFRQAWDKFNKCSGESPYSIKLNGTFMPGLKPWNISWERVKDALEWKKLRVVDIGCASGLYLACLKKYKKISLAVGVDVPKNGKPYRWKEMRDILKNTSRAFHVDVECSAANINASGFGKTLGYEFDVALLLHSLFWVQKKSELMRYLSHIPIVLYETENEHLTTRASDLFKEYGFDNMMILSDEYSGKSTFFIFYKSGYRSLIKNPI